jgi:hypothetical protein
MSCGTDAECFAASGQRCVAGNCADDCGSLFTCNSNSDCPTFDPAVGHCQLAAVGGGANGVCVYNDSSSAAIVTTLCTTGGTATLTRVQDCFDHGSNWSMGDCDNDGVANGSDHDPCNPTDMGLVPSMRSPFCLGGRICEGLSSVCGPVLRCASSECAAAAARFGATSTWQCSLVPGSSSQRVCQPPCDATAQCAGSFIDCGSFGTCVATGGASYCEATRLASCGPGCRAGTLDWASPNGDCDMDGAQNGCDPNPCNGGAGDAHCTYNGSLCARLDAGTMTRDASTGLVDGGFDASRPFDASTGFPDAFIGSGDASFTIPDGNLTLPDASFTPDVSIPFDAAVTDQDAFVVPGEDAFVVPGEDAAQSVDAGRDAGARADGGNTAMDASATPPTMTPGLGFGGGGGCRCSAPGRGPRPIGTALVALGLALAIVRRKR